MPEVIVKDEDLSGLGWTLKSLIDDNITNPEVWEKIKKIKGSMVIRESEANVTSTLFFNKGEITIANGAISKPSAGLAAGFDELAEIASGQVGPIKALLTGRIKTSGNLIKLLKMSKAIINRENK